MGIAERREREKEQRQNAIIDAAEKIFFSEGVENSTMGEVAAAAELSKGTLYLYFENKNDLYHAIVLRGLNILYEMFAKAVGGEEKGIEKLNAIGQAYFEFHRQFPNYAHAILHHEGHKIELDSKEQSPYIGHCFEAGNRLFQLMQEAVKAGISDGSLRPDLNPLLVSMVMWGHSNGIMQLIESKGEVFSKMLGIGNTEDIMDYSFQLMRCYLENRS
jgi:AcrR family transcriptional regulator